MNEFGDTLVPASYVTPDGVNLGTWVISQRQARSRMSQERAEKLESQNGWIWNPTEAKWEGWFRLLKEYVKVHGDALAPSGYETADGRLLGSWVVNQRTAKRVGRLSKERQQRLEELGGWTWFVTRRKPVRDFDDTRRFARSLGLNSQAEWRDYAKSDSRPTDIPSNPHRTYRESGWRSYPDWLGYGR